MLLGLPGLLLAKESKEVVESEASRVIIEDSRTRVFLFSVYLKVGEVVEKDKQLLGNYNIRVPSSSSDNEEGKVILELEQPLEEVIAKGGTIKGKGISTKSKHPERKITCEFKPDPKKPNSGDIRMTIDTSDRVLRFNSTYKAVLVEKKVP